MTTRRRPPFLVALALGALIVAPSRARSDDAPPKLAGSWTWTWKDAEGTTHKHVVEFEGEGAKLSATETFDDEKAVKVEALKQKGKTVSFAVDRDGRYAEYKGTVDGPDTINGRVTVTQGGTSTETGWTAAREKLKGKE